MNGLRRVFVANRGEIALRVIRACHSLGLEAVLGVSEADRESLPAQLADRVVTIGPAPSRDSYLNIAAVVTAAVGTGCDGLHPGYGFLAESPALARACRQAGLRFIGPSPEAIATMGNKVEALRHARAVGIPTLGTAEPVASVAAAEATAAQIGYPVMIKAAAGGGGRGMRVAEDARQLAEALPAAALEARSAFGDDTLYLERYVTDARHIEVQIVGDGQRVVHVGERDCSVQRRHQKVIEEALAYAISDPMRAAVREAAVRLGESLGYQSAGTVEFLVDQSRDGFYFLEMNTRIQVEHPVTEMVTGLDLVAEQLWVAGGNPLRWQQADIAFSGHAIECRITAEVWEENFRPSPGVITQWEVPTGEGIRVDSHGHAGYRIPPYYDSLLAKLICWAPDRARAVERMSTALANFRVGGVATTIPFLRALMADARYRQGHVNTHWLEEAGVEAARRWLETAPASGR